MKSSDEISQDPSQEEEESKNEAILMMSGLLSVIDESASGDQNEVGSSNFSDLRRPQGAIECDCEQGILIVDDTPFNIDVVETMLDKFH